MDKKLDDTGNSIGIFERILAMCEKYSVLQILKALAIFVLIYSVLSFTFNPKRVFEIYDEYRAGQHDAAM